MPNTYVALETVTLTSPVSSVTFNVSGLPYTDLVIVAQAKSSTAGSSVNSYRMRFNGLSTTLYSNTSMQPNGASISSTRDTNSSEMYVGLLNQTSANPESSIIHIMNYANTNVFKTVLARGASTAGSVNAIVGLWRSTAAITSIELFMTSATLTGTFSLYGIANANQGVAKATGGMITEDSQYWYHTFGASGAFIPKQSLTADILVVAGGGGAGYYYGGGGGAGGVQYAASQSLTATTYNVTIGSGGPTRGSSSPGAGTVGVDSSFSSLVIAKGGGFGNGAISGNAAGGNGGSGGGAGGPSAGASGGTATAGTGGTFYGTNGGATPGGGSGGGATQAGASVSKGGNGTSLFSSWGLTTGTGQNVSGVVYYAGGGEANGSFGGGGLGGGGAWLTSGAVNTGGGAGADQNGGAGGSGIVIVRYAK